jgi:phage gpG-like protein
MTPEVFKQRLISNQKEIEDYIKNIAPEIAGNEAVAHFRENFGKEGFVDGGLHPWPEVKRRDPDSPWYGYSPVTKSRFSPTRASDRILHDTGELMDSIDYRVTGPGEATISSDKPYAHVHNEGGYAKIFGKKLFIMPRRQFIGESQELNERIISELTRDIAKILK